MRKTKLLKQITTCVLTLSMLLPSGLSKSQIVSADKLNKTPSQLYVESMGKGWNLGNTFDGVDTDLTTEDEGEEAWGNPRVTKEFIKSIKDKGYDSIRIPMTAFKRYSEVDGKAVMNSEWIERYKEVVQWAVDEGLYVMVNLHHDSWIWLKNWDGNKESVEYKTYVELWEQLADAFKDFSDKVCFETINEPDFQDTVSDTGEVLVSAQEKLDMINIAGYESIRNSGGKNDTRMIVIPTMHTNHEEKNSKPAYNLITSLNDENVIATVHYYSEWVYSANLGKTGFDEPLWEGNNVYTPRVAAEEFFNIIYNTFTANGIGVVVGEWGLLGYDAGNECNQLGEELKYYEYMDYLASSKEICLMFWDNGSGINRLDTTNYSWKKPLVGRVLQAGIDEERSSYVTDLNTIYLNKPVEEDLNIKLTLNGNDFVGIEGLIEGVDYIYNAESATVTLKESFINNRYNKLEEGTYGNIADVVMNFSSGAPWHQYIVKYSKAMLSNVEDTTSNFKIPVKFNGAKLRRAYACNEDGNKVGPNSEWWSYLQYINVFEADYENGTINIYGDFFNYWNVNDGKITFNFEFYDGQVVEYVVTKDGTIVSGVGNEEDKDDGNNPDEGKPGTGGDNGQNPGGTDEEDKGSVNTKPENTKPSTELDKLPNTGSVVGTTVLYTISIMMIAIGAVLYFKKKEIIK